MVFRNIYQYCILFMVAAYPPSSKAAAPRSVSQPRRVNLILFQKSNILLFLQTIIFFLSLEKNKFPSLFFQTSNRIFSYKNSDFSSEKFVPQRRHHITSLYTCMFGYRTTPARRASHSPYGQTQYFFK